MATATWKERGWHLDEERMKEHINAKEHNVEKITQLARDIDLRDIGKGWLPEEINRGRCEYVQGPGVLQIQKIRNVSAPKENEESHYAPRLLKLTLTDGQNTCNGVETDKLEKIGLNTPPGTKICLKGTIEVEHGFLMLNNKNTSFVGGRVEKLAENWELKKMLSKVRTAVGNEGGPPPFVPFGQRVKETKPQHKKKENFKSLDVGKEKTVEDVEFEQQRQATIAEALQAKEESKPKSFGGGQKQVGSDAAVARIVEMGFTTAEANSALRQNNGDVNQAINSLLGGKHRGGYDKGRERGGPPGRDRNVPSAREDRREKGGRGRHGRDRDENDADVVPDTKPSGPATLFDFLETKIKPSKEDKGSSKSSQSQKPLQTSYYSNNENYKQNGNRSYHDEGQGQRNKPQTAPPRFTRNEDNNSRRDAQSRSYSNQGQSSLKNNRVQSQNSYDSDRSSASDKERNRTNYNNPKGQRSNYNDRDQSYSDSKNSFRADNKNRTQYNNDRGQGQKFDNDRGQGQRSSNFKRDQRPYSAKDDYYDEGRSSGKKDRYNDRTTNNTQSDPQSSQSRPKSSQDSRADNYSDRGNNSQGKSRNNNSYHNNDKYSSSQTKNNYYDKQFPTSKSYNESEPKKSSGFDPKAQDFVPGRQVGIPQFDPSCPPPPLHQGHPMQKQYYDNQPSPRQQNFRTDQHTQDNSPQWKKGDRCMAKYWSDNKFYLAEIEATLPKFPTCVVTFVEYGNSEEVNLTDVKPVPKHMQTDGGRHSSTDNYQNQYLPQPYAAPVPMDSYVAEQQIRSMEFRRKQSREPRQPSQQFYQPPRQRQQ